MWRSQSRGGRDLQAVGWGRPGPGEPRWGPQETEEGKAGLNTNLAKPSPQQTFSPSTILFLSETLSGAHLGKMTTSAAKLSQQFLGKQ